MQLSRRQAAALALTALCVAGGVALHLRSRSADDLERVRRETRSGQALLVDVREPYEQRLGQTLDTGGGARRWAIPLSGLVEALPDLLALPAQTPVLVFCRSGNRSARAAAALRRLGRLRAYSVSGGLALWPAAASAWQRPSQAALPTPAA